ncbi:unnamed protein product, partial [Meganyctiphanes norvegica]
VIISIRMYGFGKDVMVIKKRLQYILTLDRYTLIEKYDTSIKEPMHNAIFNWIKDDTHLPEHIILLLDTYLNSIEELSTNWLVQSLVSFSCLKGLAWRQPKVLDKEWEKVAWIFFKYSKKLHTIDSYDVEYMEFDAKTKDWMNYIFSPKHCPNPCLRLELLRFMNMFGMHDDGKPRFVINGQNLESGGFHSSLISTICEIHDNYSVLSVHQVPMCSVSDLECAMDHYCVKIRTLLNRDPPQSKIMKIAAILKLTKMFAVLEKERHLINNDPHVNFSAVLEGPYSRFLGLKHAYYNIWDVGPNIYGETELINIISNNHVLQDYAVEALNSISDLCNALDQYHQMLNDTTNGIVSDHRDMILDSLIQTETVLLPKHLLHREVYGITPRGALRIRYFSQLITHEVAGGSDTIIRDCSNQ